MLILISVLIATILLGRYAIAEGQRIESKNQFKKKLNKIKNELK
jgi:hypothetical protein